MIVIDLDVIGQETGRLGAPVDVLTVTGLDTDFKPKSTGAPAPGVYHGAGAPGVPAYKGGAESGSSSGAAQQQHPGNVNVFPIHMLNPYQNKYALSFLVYM